MDNHDLVESLEQEIERDQASIEWFKKNFLSSLNALNKKYIVLDTETTGILEDNEILQLSIVTGSNCMTKREDLHEQILFNRYFKPTHHTSWERAQAINHISPEDVANELPIENYKTQIEEIINSAEVIVGYNTSFDLEMLKINGINIKQNIEIVDVMRLITEDKIEHHSKNITIRHSTLKQAVNYWVKEDYLPKTENLNFHDSVTDSILTLILWHRFSNYLEHFYQDLEKSIEKNTRLVKFVRDDQAKQGKK